MMINKYILQKKTYKPRLNYSEIRGVIVAQWTAWSLTISEDPGSHPVIGNFLNNF